MSLFDDPANAYTGGMTLDPNDPVQQQQWAQYYPGRAFGDFPPYDPTQPVTATGGGQDSTGRVNVPTPIGTPRTTDRPTRPDPIVPGRFLYNDQQPMPAPTTAGGAPGSTAGGPPTLNRNDPASVSAFIRYYATQPGANPSLARDEGYWAGKISSGELGEDPNYIIGKFMTPEGAPAGQGGGAANGLGPFTGMSAGEFLNDPSYKFRLQQGADLINNNRATSGLLRSGGTLKALTDYGQGAASQEYQNAFNRARDVHTTNFGENYSLAGLGLNANIAGINGANGLATNASNFANTASSYANNAGNTIQGAGNAAAAGTIGSTNAYNPLYGSLAGLLTNQYYR